MTSISAAMASRMRIMGSPKVSLNSAQNVVGSESGIWLLPYFALDSATSLSLRPLKCMDSFSFKRPGKGGVRRRFLPGYAVFPPGDALPHLPEAGGPHCHPAFHAGWNTTAVPPLFRIGFPHIIMLPGISLQAANASCRPPGAFGLPFFGPKEPQSADCGSLWFLYVPA